MTLAPEVMDVLANAAAEVELFDKITDALRVLESSGGVRQVVASPAHGSIIVIDHEYRYVALQQVEPPQVAA